MPTWGAASERGSAWPTEPQRLLLQAALLPDERALEAWRRVRPHVDVATLDGAVQTVLPHLHANLVALGVEDELLALFKGVHRYVWAANQLLFGRMMPVVAALERAGVSTLLLKGAATIAGSRLDAGMRRMNDIDVLVPTELLPVAVDVLVSSGLTPMQELPAWFVSEQLPVFMHSQGFEVDDGRRLFYLDLHWHALRHCRRLGDDGDFWARARPATIKGVRTRVLDPADELLLVVLHGLVWDPTPPYRWVLDAALIVRGERGRVDFERLVEQARRRRLTSAVAAGLSYLRRVVDSPVPASAVRALRLSPAGLTERLERRALMRAPWERPELQWAAIRRRERERRRSARAQRAPLRRSTQLGERLDFGDPQRVREHVRFGAWRPEEGGCWLAGEAGLTLRLAKPAKAPLLLGISAGVLVMPGQAGRQRVELIVNGARAARLSLDARCPELHDEMVVLPPEAVAGRDTLELTFRALDPTVPSRYDRSADVRELGIFLRGLVIREPPVCAAGSKLALGGGAPAPIAGGWSYAEAEGRWTRGARAGLLIGVADSDRPVAVEIDALPVRPGQRVGVRVNGGRRRGLRWDGPAVHRIPVGRTNGEVLVDLHIKDPVSPAELGQSADARPLGLFVHSVALVHRGSA